MVPVEWPDDCLRLSTYMPRSSSANDRRTAVRPGQSGRSASWRIALSCLCWVLTALPLRLAAADASRITLANSLHVESPDQPRPQAVVARTDLLPEEAAAEMDFAVVLRMRNFGELQGRIAAGELIAPEEMAAKYWPLATDEAAVADWLQGEDFTVTRRDDNHLAVFARGTVSRVQSAFQTTFARITFEGVDYTSAVTVPSLPAGPGRAVLGVNGLQPHLHPRPLSRIRPLAADNTPPYLPAQITKAYQANELGLTGAGQTIAIVMSTSPRDTDLLAFWKEAGIAQSLSNMQTVQVISGVSPNPDLEVSLDAEWSSSMAPGAKVRVYATKALYPTQLGQAYQQIYKDALVIPGLRQLSLSYGIGESAWAGAQLQSDAQFFANLASAGVTVFASSGDDGSSPKSIVEVLAPACDVNVTAVGGTSLYLDAAGAVSQETTWSGSGGGISKVFDRPTWQKGLGITAESKRLVPDVAMPADPYTGAVVYLAGTRYTVGGTSWSAPTWAGFCALLNQARANAGRPPVGVLGANVYPLLGTDCFRDITTGKNGAYYAGPGYDRCTGLGVPNVAALVLNLAAGLKITVQPADQTLALGASAVFSVTASAVIAFSYQWQVRAPGTTNWNDLANGGGYNGVKASQLTIANTGGMNGSQFRCRLSSSAGTLSTRVATLTVNAANLAQVGVDPGIQSVPIGSPLQTAFVFANTGNRPTLATKVYLYFSLSPTNFGSGAKVGEIILPALAAGVNTGTLPFSYLPPAGTALGTYSLNYWIDAPGLVAEGNENDNRGSRTFLLRPAGPSFTLVPTNQAVTAGAVASFTVATQGTAPFSYRWSRKPNGNPTWKSLGNDSFFAGVDQPTLTVSHVTPGMNGDQFECVVTNSVAAITSSAATLFVTSADLTMVGGGVVPSLGSPGTSFTRTIVVTNQGSAASIPTRVDFFINPTPGQFAGGTNIGSVNLPGLPVGTAASLQFAYQSPTDAPLGTYSFYYVIDAGNLVAERDEANNVFGGNITLVGIETRPQPVIRGVFQLLFRYADGSTPTLNGWSVQWRSDPPQGTDTNWNTFTAPLYVTNGFVGVSDTNVLQQPRRYFRVTGQ